MSVGQGYQFIEGQNDYKMSTGTIYRECRQPINIEKSNNNFKDGKPKCFNCNKYGHMAKKCQLKKKEHETRHFLKCFKCNKEGYIIKDYKDTQSMKKRKVQEGLDNKDKEKKQSFGDNLE